MRLGREIREDGHAGRRARIACACAAVAAALVVWALSPIVGGRDSRRGRDLAQAPSSPSAYVQGDGDTPAADPEEEAPESPIEDALASLSLPQGSAQELESLVRTLSEQQGAPGEIWGVASSSRGPSSADLELVVDGASRRFRWDGSRWTSGSSGERSDTLIVIGDVPALAEAVGEGRAEAIDRAWAERCAERGLDSAALAAKVDVSSGSLAPDGSWSAQIEWAGESLGAQISPDGACRIEGD